MHSPEAALPRAVLNATATEVQLPPTRTHQTTGASNV